MGGLLYILRTNCSIYRSSARKPEATTSYCDMDIVNGFKDLVSPTIGNEMT